MYVQYLYKESYITPPALPYGNMAKQNPLLVAMFRSSGLEWLHCTVTYNMHNTVGNDEMIGDE